MSPDVVWLRLASLGGAVIPNVLLERISMLNAGILAFRGNISYSVI
jgi:hypothetical protein